jgi:hypothetical protein
MAEYIYISEDNQMSWSTFKCIRNTNKAGLKGSQDK